MIYEIGYANCLIRTVTEDLALGKNTIYSIDKANRTAVVKSTLIFFNTSINEMNAANKK
jgi:hypothetical protein